MDRKRHHYAFIVLLLAEIAISVTGSLIYGSEKKDWISAAKHCQENDAVLISDTKDLSSISTLPEYLPIWLGRYELLTRWAFIKGCYKIDETKSKITFRESLFLCQNVCANQQYFAIPFNGDDCHCLDASFETECHCNDTDCYQVYEYFIPETNNIVQSTDRCMYANYCQGQTVVTAFGNCLISYDFMCNNGTSLGYFFNYESAADECHKSGSFLKSFQNTKKCNIEHQYWTSSRRGAVLFDLQFDTDTSGLNQENIIDCYSLTNNNEGYPVTAKTLCANKLSFFCKKESCVGRCDQAFDDNFQCQCNTACTSYDDCCDDYKAFCLGDLESCVGRCGQAFNDNFQCQCNTACTTHDDCCDDYHAICLIGVTCVERCNTIFDKTQPCQCNSACVIYGNCCQDYNAICQGLSSISTMQERQSVPTGFQSTTDRIVPSSSSQDTGSNMTEARTVIESPRTQPAGIVAGVIVPVLAIILIVIVVVVLKRRRNGTKDKKEAMSNNQYLYSNANPNQIEQRPFSVANQSYDDFNDGFPKSSNETMVSPNYELAKDVDKTKAETKHVHSYALVNKIKTSEKYDFAQPIAIQSDYAYNSDYDHLHKIIKTKQESDYTLASPGVKYDRDSKTYDTFASSNGSDGQQAGLDYDHLPTNIGNDPTYDCAALQSRKQEENNYDSFNQH